MEHEQRLSFKQEVKLGIRRVGVSLATCLGISLAAIGIIVELKEKGTLTPDQINTVTYVLAGINALGMVAAMELTNRNYLKKTA